MDKQQLIAALVAHDSSRPRSLQTAVGVSSLGDCKRKVWHMVQGDAVTNQNTLRLPAILGTAIHSAIEGVVGGDGILIEHRVEIEGLPPATIDYFDTVAGEVVDWKTITLKNVDYFVTQQKRWQVQVYGYLMTKAGYQVNTVKLIGIPRDGTENDIVEHSEPYDEAVAIKALNWLDEIRGMDDAPEPEREPKSFCQKYCQFYGLCTGITPAVTKGKAIADNQAARAASRYVEVLAESKALDAEKDALKATLEGVAGVTFDGVQVSWSEVAGRKTPDTDAIQKLLGDQPIPMKEGSSSLRLSVK